jgi:hypothetical protein
MVSLTRVVSNVMRAAGRAYTSQTAYVAGVKVATILVITLLMLTLALRCGPSNTSADEVARRLCEQHDPWCPPGARAR